jgi:hypothetical protein
MVEMKHAWGEFLRHREGLASHAVAWSGTLAQSGNLTDKLIDFIENRI